MQLQQRLLDLFEKKVKPFISPASKNGSKNLITNNINKELLDSVISEQLLNLNTRIEQGTEVKKKLSMEFIKWVIIGYNLKSAEKIDPENLDIINQVFKRLKERSVALDEDDVNKIILNKK